MLPDDPCLYQSVSQPFHSAAIMSPRSNSNSQERLIAYIHADQSGFGMIGRTGRRSRTGEMLRSLLLRAQTMTHGLK